MWTWRSGNLSVNTYDYQIFPQDNFSSVSDVTLVSIVSYKIIAKITWQSFLFCSLAKWLPKLSSSFWSHWLSFQWKFRQIQDMEPARANSTPEQWQMKLFKIFVDVTYFPGRLESLCLLKTKASLLLLVTAVANIWTTCMAYENYK